MWLYYWLASGGVNPLTDMRAIVVPPTQMVAHVRDGSVDGFSAGEPWNHRGIMDGVSVHGGRIAGHLARPPGEGAGNHRATSWAITRTPRAP